MAKWKVRKFEKKVHGRKQKFEDTYFKTREEAEKYADQFKVKPQVYLCEVMNG
ncbi:hypothetical protein [Streptococcus parauberis]|uniref:hypothetical protein n=1 Tax=Streptococcus parauberis TaxID=1348 RepID=UPI0037AA24F4